METPVRKRQRSRLSSSAFKGKNSASTVSQTGVVFGVACKEDDYQSPKCQRSRRRFREEDDSVMPCTQSMVDSKSGVYWNYEASPSVKAELQRLLRDSDDDEELPPPPPLTPVMKLRSVSRVPSSPVKMSDEAREIFESMKEIYAKMQSSTPKTSICSDHLPDDPPKAKGGPPKEEDLFGNSADDSLLVLCTQAAEEEAKKDKAKSRFTFVPNKAKARTSAPEKASVPLIEKPSKKEEDPFNDSFDELLSQMEIPSASVRTNSGIPSAAGSSSLSSGYSSNQTVSQKWRKSLSTPTATTTSDSLLPSKDKGRQRYPSAASVKCTQEQIEKKRLEAIKKRQLSKQRMATANAGKRI